MCQSKAEGGRRCAFHLEQAVGTGLTTYAVSVTGVNASDARDAYERLEREGLAMPDPTREEVDEFLEQQVFRVRHEPEITEARRESIINRLKAAIGRVLPNGATFHAWKNIVAESFAKVRRRAAAAFLVGALSMGVGACGTTGDTEPPDRAEPVAAAPSTPGQEQSAPAATQWQIDDTVDAQVALLAFSQSEVDSAVETVTDATTEYAFNEDIIRDTTPTVEELDGVTQFMTPQCAENWRTLTARYASDNGTDRDRVSIALLAFPNINEQGYRVQKNGPAVVNQSIDSIVVTSEVIDGVTYMKVTEKVSGDVRLTHEGANVVSHAEKTVTFYMHGVKDHGKTVWKIDGYTGRFPASAQTVTPEA